MKTLKIAMIILLICLNKVQAQEEIAPREETLVIGRVSDNPKKHYPRVKAIVDYAANHMKDLGITQGSAILFNTNKELIEALNEGKIDWVTETPFSAIIFQEATGAEIILRRWKKGVPEYYTVIFTRKDSGINSLSDLKGKRIAFEDPGSTTAYFVPLALLKEEGLELVRLSSPREEVPPTKVGYAFAGGELNISTWVYMDLTDAGAFSNLDWEDPDNTPDVFKKDLKIISQSRPFPRAAELVRKDLDPKIKERLKEVLLKAHEDPEAKEALEAYDETRKFDEFTEGTKGSLDEVHRLLEFIREELR